MKLEKQKIGITMGDPAGIGPEIILKALDKEEIRDLGDLIVLGDKKVLKYASKISNVRREINVLEDDFNSYKKEQINVYDLDNVNIDNLKMGEIQENAGIASFEYIKKAVELALDKKIDAVVTAPINKEALRKADVEYIGHTEMLGDLTDTDYPLTMFQVLSLKVFFLTRHMSLIDACKAITQAKVYKGIEESVGALNNLGVDNPRLAVAALNPHAGEHGLFGYEEVKEITPAVNRAQEEGYNVVGPVPADSVFHFGLNGKYDAVLSLYHDQGHIATKMVDFERTISITNNLPFLRTSVDHGTAFDIAGEGKASSVSMEEGIRLAFQYAPYFNNQ